MSLRSRLLVYGSLASLALVADSRSEASSCVPGFDYAIFAKNTLQIQGNAGTDSFDSSAGTYATTASCADGSIGTDSTQGGAIALQGASTKICGNAQVGVGGNPSTAITMGTATVTGTRTALSSTISMPNVTIPSLPNASPLSPSYTNTNATLAAGKTYGAVSCKNGSLTLNAGTYVVSSLTLTSGCQLKLASGQVSFYFTAGIYLQAGAVLNTTSIPGNMVFYGGPAAHDVQVQGGAGAYFAVYAPAASCQIQGNADIWGAMVCSDAQIQGNAHIHFDKALRNLSGGGFACTVTTTEISRANPIVATISNQTAVVQGTFESPSGSAKTIAAVSDVATFAFPYLKGHLRARVASSISSAASTFSSGTVLFDVAATGKIPTVDNTGCSTFTGTCRHVFTITSTPATGSATLFHPTMVDFKDANASTIGAIIAPASTVSGIGATQWLTIERDVLAGSLGGVDRSTAAVIGASSFAGNPARPTIVYFGAADGMLHAACASTGGTTASGSNICPSLGTELWAFAPREQLSLMRTNTQRIDGSPHVLDVFGDFANPATGVRSWHTILMFSTGYAGTSRPATYALDITDPANPSVVWEYTTPSTADTLDFGTGLSITSGEVTIVGAPTYLAFVETSNGGSGGAGVVTTAINIVTGQQQWRFGYLYPSPPRSASADLPLPSTGIPGGASAADLTGGGFVTDVVFGDLYGDVWRVNAASGASQEGTDTPLFRFTGNKHPVGVVPTIYSNGGQQYAFFTSGGYVDPTAASWSATTQYLIGVKLKATSVPVTEQSTTCASCDLVISSTLTSGDKGFAQAVVVGTQLFLTSDSTDVNSSTFGTGGNTGHLTTVDLAGQSVGATVAIAAGASAVAHAGATLYTSSAQSQQRLSTAASTTTGTATEISGTQVFKRQLWLRTK